MPENSPVHTFTTLSARMRERPLLLVDVDGVISLFGFPSNRRPDGSWLNVDGILHLVSATAGGHLHDLTRSFELAWCTGWEEKANEHLVRALGLAGPLPCLSFDCRPEVRAHWKLAAIDAYAGAGRPLAWIDDAFDEACHAWAAARLAPTLLVATEPATGITQAHVDRLTTFAAALGPAA
jgi:hypothetical protein